MLIPNDYFSINIRKSETARRDICRGLSLAENPFRLLIIAIECIADMSGDGTFLLFVMSAVLRKNLWSRS